MKGDAKAAPKATPRDAPRRMLVKGGKGHIIVPCANRAICFVGASRGATGGPRAHTMHWHYFVGAGLARRPASVRWG